MKKLIILLSLFTLNITAQVNRHTQIQWGSPNYQYHPINPPNYQQHNNTYQTNKRQNTTQHEYENDIQKREYENGYAEGYKYGYRDGQNSNVLLPCVVGVIYPPSNGEYTYSNGYSYGYRKGLIEGRRDDPYK
ncbi:MAG: hypothetical protein KF900_12190 [Bacteroidetes bacterium]|nr:hypothetical protein [Bacteroidota bacterium]